MTYSTIDRFERRSNTDAHLLAELGFDRTVRRHEFDSPRSFVCFLKELSVSAAMERKIFKTLVGLRLARSKPFYTEECPSEQEVQQDGDRGAPVDKAAASTRRRQASADFAFQGVT